MGRMEKGHVAPSRFVVSPPPPAAVVDLRGIISALGRQRRAIAASVLICGILGILVALLIPARYIATTEVYLDPRNLEVLQNELNPAVGNGDESTLISQSQVQLVRSTDVLKSVVRSLQLDKDVDFGAPDPGLLETIKTNLLGPPNAASVETGEIKAVRALSRDLSVRRTDKTYVIEIGVKTSEAGKSAEVANAVASAFIGEVSRSRVNEVKRSSTALDGRLAELRSRLKASDDAIERYRKDHDLIGAGGRLISEQQLGEMTTQLSNAQNAVTEAHSRLEAIRRMRQDSDLPGDTNEAVKSTALAAVRATLAQAKRAAAEAAVTYGPRYPMTRELAARVNAARQQLDAEIARIDRSAETDLERTKGTANQLSQKLAALKATSGQANEASVELRELEREASSNRAVYEAFLNRTKDLQERLYLDTVNARIVTEAMPPLTRAGLSKTIIAAIGLFVGLLIGLMVALLRDHAEAPVESFFIGRDAL